MDKNTLYYGDNLDILRRYLDDESVDLIYLDLPFNSNADYNVLFAEKDGTKAHAQIQAFEDTWQCDTVLDPFCGCGTTIAAAQKLNRRWIGIDITHIAI